jgi:hypothetical protein
MKQEKQTGMQLSSGNPGINSGKKCDIAIDDTVAYTGYDIKNKINRKLVDKYMFLKINGKRRFFKIVKVHGNKNYKTTQQSIDFFMRDSMVCGVVDEGKKKVPVFDFRNKNVTDDEEIKPDKYIKVTIEDYENNIDIGIVYKDVNDIINIPSLP